MRMQRERVAFLTGVAVAVCISLLAILFSSPDERNLRFPVVDALTILLAYSFVRRYGSPVSILGTWLTYSVSVVPIWLPYLGGMAVYRILDEVPWNPYQIRDPPLSLVIVVLGAIASGLVIRIESPISRKAPVGQSGATTDLGTPEALTTQVPVVADQALMRRPVKCDFAGREGQMAPEEVFSLIAVSLRIESGRLLADGEEVELPIGPLYVSWYATSAAEGQVPITRGLVYVPDAPQLTRHEIRNYAPSDLGNQYRWRHFPPKGGPMMFAMSLPAGYTIIHSEPKPVEAKEHKGTIAVFWILPQATQVSLTWQVGELRTDLVEEVRKINREGLDQLLPTRAGGFDYDVALSFAGEDRPYVERVAVLLKEAGVKVFYDRFEEASLWGKNLYDHLNDVYGKQARYTVMFISQHYAKKAWTSHERESAQARALEENSECILPVRFDDTKVPGLPTTVGYLSLQGRDPKDLADLIIQKVSL